MSCSSREQTDRLLRRFRTPKRNTGKPDEFDFIFYEHWNRDAIKYCCTLLCWWTHPRVGRQRQDRKEHKKGVCPVPFDYCHCCTTVYGVYYCCTLLFKDFLQLSAPVRINFRFFRKEKKKKNLRSTRIALQYCCTAHLQSYEPYWALFDLFALHAYSRAAAGHHGNLTAIKWIPVASR